MKRGGVLSGQYEAGKDRALFRATRKIKVRSVKVADFL
jgi:hypothetical protein